MSVTWSATAEEAGVPSAETAVPSQPPQTAAAPAAAPAAEPDEDSATSILVDCGSILVHVICALVQGVIGLLPLMLMWSVLCTLAAVTFVPMDLVLASAHVIRQGRQQGFLKTSANMLVVVIVVIMWPVVVCSFHCMAAFVLAFSEPFERQAHGDWQSVATGGLRSMFTFAHERMVDFMKLCWVNHIDFWMKWKMMIRSVTAFTVFFIHSTLVLLSTVLLMVIKLPVFAMIGAKVPWQLVVNIGTAIAAHSKPAQAALWAASLPIMLPMCLLLSALCCTFYVVTYTISGIFLVLMSVLGGGLYAADATFKKMSGRLTFLAMAYVITEFDRDTSEIMRNIVSEEALIPRILPVLPDPYPEFTAEETTNALNVNPNVLDESCEAFLDTCREQGQTLLATGCLDVQDFHNAEPFIFMGIPGHALLHYIQQSPYERLLLKPGMELKLREDFLGTSWVDPLRQDLLNVQIQVFETCIKESEWRYLKTWVVLSGDDERLASLGMASPQDQERGAQLHRVASAINSMAISITRMAWFQTHFKKKVMDRVINFKTLLDEANIDIEKARLRVYNLPTLKADIVASEDIPAALSSSEQNDVVLTIPSVLAPSACVNAPASNEGPTRCLLHDKQAPAALIAAFTSASEGSSCRRGDAPACDSFGAAAPQQDEADGRSAALRANIRSILQRTAEARRAGAATTAAAAAAAEAAANADGADRDELGGSEAGSIPESGSTPHLAIEIREAVP